MHILNYESVLWIQSILTRIRILFFTDMNLHLYMNFLKQNLKFYLLQMSLLIFILQIIILILVIVLTFPLKFSYLMHREEQGPDPYHYHHNGSGAEQIIRIRNTA